MFTCRLLSPTSILKLCTAFWCIWSLVLLWWCLKHEPAFTVLASTAVIIFVFFPPCDCKATSKVDTCHSSTFSVYFICIYFPNRKANHLYSHIVAFPCLGQVWHTHAWCYQDTSVLNPIPGETTRIKESDALSTSPGCELVLPFKRLAYWGMALL